MSIPERLARWLAKDIISNLEREIEQLKNSIPDDPPEILQTPHSIKQIAEHYSYTPVASKDPNKISFLGVEARIDIWPSKMTVATVLRHPYKGKTQLFRRHVSLALLNKIF